MSTPDARTIAGRHRRDGAREQPMVPRARPQSYYGRPVVKPPVWKPEIPWYFFAGGLGGGSAALGLASGWAGNRHLARRAWAVALLGVSASPILLTADLGRPERFLNMFRVFKVTSPMSMGSWLLVAGGMAATPAAAYAFTGRPRRLGPPAQVAAGVLGLPLATYTGVLISNTAIPVWSEARRELPVVFAASAAASAGAAAAVLTPPRHAGPGRRLAVVGALGEVAATQLMRRRLGIVGEPYHRGDAGRYSKLAEALTLGGATLVAASRRRRAAAIAGGAMVLAGAVCERWAVFKAGFESARDPRYTVETQRS